MKQARHSTGVAEASQRWRRRRALLHPRFTLMVGLLGLMLGLSFLPGLVACSQPSPVDDGPDDPVREKTPAESQLVPLTLTGPASLPQAEISGLTWYRDHLILLPENVGLEFSLMGELQPGPQYIYAIPRTDIEAAIADPDALPLEPIAIPVTPENLPRTLIHFDGFEGIAFAGDRAFLTIEAGPDNNGKTAAFLISGQMDPELKGLDIDIDHISAVVSQTDIPNISEEALVIDGDEVVTFHEINSVVLNPTPVAHRFDFEGRPTGILVMPRMEYRVTDATSLDAEKRFWVINYLFPGSSYSGEFEHPDDIGNLHGQGRTHRQYRQVERLVELRLGDDGEVHLTDSPPIQIELAGDWEDGDSRNWEGLARMGDEGFIIVSDKFPTTVLGFVPLPE